MTEGTPTRDTTSGGWRKQPPEFAARTVPRAIGPWPRPPQEATNLGRCSNCHHDILVIEGLAFDTGREGCKAMHLDEFQLKRLARLQDLELDDRARELLAGIARDLARVEAP